jgi:predicted N-acetyltransferase YhbS
MTIKFHPYNRPIDFDRVGDFLIRHYQPGNRDGNWIQPMWEYMHSHPFLDVSALDRIGVWEDAGEIVGVCHYESTLGEVFFELHPAYPQLKHEMLDHAERQLWGTGRTGRRYLQVFVNDFDAEFEMMVEAHGFVRNPEDDRPLYQYTIPDPFPVINLLEGFRLKSLQDDNDLHKIDLVLWRGFNHPGDPPPDEIDDRRKMQSVPNFRLDLNIVVVAPDGNFAAYSGTWYEPANRICYVEPVATDPEYRRLGLGKAAVLEGIRRCAALGATVAFVGNDLPFYQAIGFTPLYTDHCWVKYRDR